MNNIVKRCLRYEQTKVKTLTKKRRAVLFCYADQLVLGSWQLKKKPIIFVSITTNMQWSLLISIISYQEVQETSGGVKIMILFQKLFLPVICSCNAAIANEWRLDLCNQEKSSFLTTYYVLYLLGLQYSQNFKIQKADPEMIATRYCCNTAAIKLIYSEKASKFCEIFPLLLTACTVFKSKGKISQNFVAFSECMNFTQCGK